MTIIETLPGAFTGGLSATLPKYKLDPIIEEGTMFLIEPAASWGPGIPANHSLVSNLAASKLTKRGYDTALTWVMDPEANNGSNGKMERTAKGGLHGMASRTIPIPIDKGAAVLFPNWFADYVAANPSHEFGWSIWQRPTRAYTGGGSIITSAMCNNSVTTGGIAQVPYLGLTNYIAKDQVNRSSRLAVPYAADAETMKMERSRPAMTFMRRSIINRDYTTNLPSYIIYRLTVEDLTVSGRSYADFSAIDLDEFTKAFAVGGRYYGDTYSDPATLVP